METLGNRLFAGAVIRRERLRRDWSQEGLSRGICAVSYLSKIEQGKAEGSGEVLRLLLERLDVPWYDDPETMEVGAELVEHPDYLHHPEYGAQLLQVFQDCQTQLPISFAAFHLPRVLEWYTANRQYRNAYELLPDFPIKPDL